VAVVVTTGLSWGVGFENNMPVKISAIHSQLLKQAVTKYNRTIDAISDMTEKRAELIQTLNVNKAALDAHAMLDTRHAAERLALRIEDYKKNAAGYRRQMRSLLFGGVRDKDGTLGFHPIDQIADHPNGDGRIWRLDVGKTALQTDRLQMIGGGDVVGDIPRGLPSISLPHIDYQIILHLLPFVVIISLLGFTEAISVAKAMAAKTGQRLDPNRELIGQGLANICGAVAKSYPISGSFSRSAVNLQSGAVSSLSSVFTSLSVVAVLLVLTPLFYHLPQSVLAAIIMIAVFGLINVKGFIHAWQAQWYDGVISIITFISTLAFAPHLDRGIMIGAGPDAERMPG
jgi:hypothetical protein